MTSGFHGPGLDCGLFDAVAGAFEGDDVGVVDDLVIIAEVMAASPNTCPIGRTVNWWSR